MRNRIIEIARNEIGYKETGNNQTKYGEWYGMQDEWCNMFVCWCANQAGIGTDIIPKEAYVPTTANWFDKKGQYKNSKVFGGNYVPLPGDIVLFDYNYNTTSDHIGIVEKVEGNTLYTIEGNKDNMVKRCIYDLSSKDIRAYCVPSYTGEVPQPTPAGREYIPGPYKVGSRGINVQSIQHELQAQGYDCGWSGEDGIFGKDTKNAVLRFQKYHGLKVDGVVGPQTWKVLYK